MQCKSRNLLRYYLRASCVSRKCMGVNRNSTPLFQDSDTCFTPIPWEMSAMEWRKVIGSPYCDLTPTQKHVLTVMCRFGKKWGEDIFPSQRAIEFRAGVSLRCVNETMQTAEKQGWLIRNMSSNRRGWRHTTYQLAIPTYLADATAFMKAKFWEPPYKYEIVRHEDQITVTKL